MTSDHRDPSRADVVIFPLTEADAERFWSRRPRALRDLPEAVGRASDAEHATPLDPVRARIPSFPDGFVLGARRDGDPAGSAGLRRMDPRNERPKAAPGGVYVPPRRVA